MRNREGHTPLFLAAQAGQAKHVELLREAGAHLHSEEVSDARHLAKRVVPSEKDGVDSSDAGSGVPQNIWLLAGLKL